MTTFRDLHAPGDLLVLPNAWDAVSARLFEECGARAIATTSTGVAWAQGFPDGNALPPPVVVAAVAAIARVVRVPVSADVEAGYASDPQAVGQLVSRVLDAGAVGVNLEDGGGSAEDHVERVRAARAAVPALVINARTDLYLIGRPDFDETVRRAAAYADAGADSIFVPGVSDEETIGRLAAAIDAPLNVLAVPGTPPVAELERLGVARVSVGSGLMRAMSSQIRAAAGRVYESGSFADLDGAVGFRELGELLEAGL